jgi:hypothetical protein
LEHLELFAAGIRRETSQRAFIACASSAPLPGAAWNVTTSRTAMAFPSVPESVSTSIIARSLPHQARPGMGKKLTAHRVSGGAESSH